MADSVSQLVLRARDEVAQTLTAVRNQARRTQDELSRIDRPPRNLLQALGTLRERLRGAQVDARNLRAAFDQVAVAGAKIGAAGGAVTAVNAAAVTQAAEYSRQIGLIATLSEEGAEATDRLSQEVIALSDEFGQDRADVAGAYYQALSVGAREGAEALELLEVAARGAQAGDSTLQESLTSITAIVNAYGMEFSEAGEVSDVLFATIEQGNTTMAQLGASIANVTPTAAGLGVEFEEVGAAIAALTLGGTQTAQATTQINSLLQALAAGGEEVQAIFADLGGAEAALATEGLQAAIGRLTEASGGSVAVLKEMLGSQEAVAAALALGGKQADAFAGALERTSNAAGASEEAYAIMAATLGAKLDRALKSVSNAFLQLGLALAPIAGVILDVVGYVASLAGEFIAANPGIASFVAALGAVALGVGAVLVAIGTLGPAFALLASTAGGATGALTGLLRLVTGGLGAGIASLGTVLGTARVALVGLTRAALAFVATPVGAALTGAAVAVGYMLNEVRKLNAEMAELARAGEAAADWYRDLNAVLRGLEASGASQELVDAARELQRLGTLPGADLDALAVQRDALEARLDGIRQAEEAERAAIESLASARVDLDESRAAAELEAVKTSTREALDGENKRLRAALDRVREAEQAEAEAARQLEAQRQQNADVGADIDRALGGGAGGTNANEQLSRILRLRQEIAAATSSAEAEAAQAALAEEVAAAARIEDDGDRIFNLEQLRALNSDLGDQAERIAQREAEQAAQRTATAEEEVAGAQARIETLEAELTALAEQGNVPIDFDVTQAEEKLEGIRARLDELRESAANLSIGAGAPGAATPAFARGGPVRGKGGVDNILAWLSNREYVVNARRAGRFAGVLDVINYGSEAMLSRLAVPAFAAGGPVGDLAGSVSGLAAPNAGAASGTPVNVHLDGREFPMRADTDVAAQLQRALSIEVLKRGRR